jgi:hypothetical protein
MSVRGAQQRVNIGIAWGDGTQIAMLHCPISQTFANVVVTTSQWREKR